MKHLCSLFISAVGILARSDGAFNREAAKSPGILWVSILLKTALSCGNAQKVVASHLQMCCLSFLFYFITKRKNIQVEWELRPDR